MSSELAGEQETQKDEEVPVKVDAQGDYKLIRQRRKGQKYCGFCCDMRRAVIIVNFLSISIVIATMIAFLVANRRYEYITEHDGQVSGITDFIYGLPFKNPPYVVFSCFKILAAGLGVFVGLRYECISIGIAASAILTDFVYSLCFLRFPWMVVSFFMFYPHVILIQEILAGTMSEDNYHNEEVKCCGVL